MKTFFASSIFAALLTTEIQAIRLGETQIVKIIPDEYDLLEISAGEA